MIGAVVVSDVVVDAVVPVGVMGALLHETSKRVKKKIIVQNLFINHKTILSPIPLKLLKNRADNYRLLKCAVIIESCCIPLWINNFIAIIFQNMVSFNIVNIAYTVII